MGWKGASAGAARNTAPTFVPGLRTIFSAASRVVAGAPTPVVAAVNSGAQPAVPSEFTHAANTSASVFSFAVSTSAPAGRADPGERPVLLSARFAALANAFASPFAFVGLAPTCPFAPVNCAKDQAAPTVVTSLMTTFVALVSAPQLPNAATSTSAGLVLPEARPGFPPRATRYTCVFALGQV